MNMNKEFRDELSFKDMDHKIGLRGHVKIEVEDRDTKEGLSGMKMTTSFLYLECSIV